VKATQELDARVQELEVLVERLSSALEVREAAYEKLLSEMEKSEGAERDDDDRLSTLKP